MAPPSVLCGVPVHTMVTIYQAASGIMNLWLKFVGKLLTILVIVNLSIAAAMSVFLTV